jgi:ribosome-associated heat shock protein Hsp15
MTAGPSHPIGGGVQRVDKWLWFARVVKTRTLAARLVAEGKVRVNRSRIDKPSYTIKAGDVVTLTIHARLRLLRVVGAGARRGPPQEAQTLYDDISPPHVPPGVASADERQGLRPRGSGRPTKRERRQIGRLLTDDGT